MWLSFPHKIKASFDLDAVIFGFQGAAKRPQPTVLANAGKAICALLPHGVLAGQQGAAFLVLVLIDRGNYHMEVVDTTHLSS